MKLFIKLINVLIINNFIINYLIICNYYMKCRVSDNSFKFVSIIISFIVAMLLYKIMLSRNGIILNYELDDIDIIDKCY